MRKSLAAAVAACTLAALPCAAPAQPPGAAPPEAMRPGKQVRQVEMEAAIDHLNKAKALLGAVQPGKRADKDVRVQLEKAHARLQEATANKGGHRVKAMKLIKQAIKAGTSERALQLMDQATAEIMQGMEYAATRK